MRKPRFFHTIQMKLIIIYVLLILFAIQLIGIYFIRTMEDSFKTNFSDSLKTKATLVAKYVEDYIPDSQDSKRGQEGAPENTKSPMELSAFIGSWVRESNAEIQVIDASGTIISTSQPNSEAILEKKNTEYVVSRALQNIRDKDNERIVKDQDGNLKKVIAMPVGSEDKVIGAVYIVASMQEVYDTINRINQIFLSGTFIAVALTVLLGVILSHTITSPIKEITRQVTSVAEGNLGRRVKVYAYDEIGQLSNAFNDMTARLKEALLLNEEEKGRLASILINMSEGVIAADDQGYVIIVNDRARQMLQLEEKAMLGRHFTKLLRFDEDTDSTMYDGESTRLVERTFVENGSEEGETRKLLVKFTSIMGREQELLGTIIVLQDVTEQEEIELSRREFVANVSHELRTPLTTIKSYLEALEDGALDDAQLSRRFVGVAHNETERMIRIVTDLLHLSRFDSKQAALNRQWINIPDMLEEVADRFSFQLSQRDISIDVHVSAAMDAAFIDRDKIDQLLDNLVSNAIKYTGDGGQIILSACQKEDWLEIAVADTGIGIPKKDQARIFERFYRVDKARSRNMGGTGLGLAIAREIIRAHGGTIALESEHHHGTKVTFTLPYDAEEDAGWND